MATKSVADTRHNWPSLFPSSGSMHYTSSSSMIMTVGEETMPWRCQQYPCPNAGDLNYWVRCMPFQVCHFCWGWWGMERIRALALLYANNDESAATAFVMCGGYFVHRLEVDGCDKHLSFYNWIGIELMGVTGHVLHNDVNSIITIQ